MYDEKAAYPSGKWLLSLVKATQAMKPKRTSRSGKVRFIKIKLNFLQLSTLYRRLFFQQAKVLQFS